MTTILILIIAFSIYHNTYFSYAAYIFNYNKDYMNFMLVTAMINFSFWLIYILYFYQYTEAFAMIGYFILLFIQCMIFFKLNFLHSIFIAVTFALNLFAKRFIIIAILALIYNESMREIVSDVNTRFFILAISSAVSISTIEFARKRIERVYLDTILSEEKNITFITIVFAVIYISLIIFGLVMYSNVIDSNFIYHYLLTGTMSIVLFFIFILYAYNIADLRINTDTYHKIKKTLEADKEHIEKLKEESITDVLTNLYTRDFIDEKIREYMTLNVDFYVIFIDLDGLKFVNDVFGHEEGDRYIKMTSEIINNYFNDASVGRYGGDEIVVVGQYSSENLVTANIVKCYNTINKLSNKQLKYESSISYGLVFKNHHENLTYDKLISLADERMYNFKKLKNKSRKTISIK